jgi:asparagine synthetase B (glutamine-hydrolysing)
MPGLVGMVPTQRREPWDRDLFQRMVVALRHRPWYQVDTYQVPDLTIARLHLNVINPTPQPYTSHGGQLQVFLHGEIYNDGVSEAHQLEFIARAYERCGRDFAAQLNGSFVVLLIDETTHTLLIATDRTASKPVFYCQTDAWLYFAPEPKALVLIPSLPKQINASALASFLACGHYLNGQTLLEGIRPLDNATVLIANSAGVTTHKYWDYSFNEAAKDRGVVYYQRALGDLIRQAVHRRTRSPHRYGILLSGGYDSRGILGCYLEEHPQEPVTTISWGVAEDTPGSDCAVAQRLALNLGLSHTFYPLRMTRLAQHVREFVALHDGLTDACHNYPESLQIFRDIHTELGVDVILRGDESFGFSKPACNRRTVFEKFGIVPFDRSRLYTQILHGSWLSTFSESIQQTTDELYLKSKTKNIYLSQSFIYFDQRIKHYISYLNYVKSIDVEVRTPYLDNDILDFMSELPAPYHYGKQFYRELMLKMFPKIFSEMATRSNLPNLDHALRTYELKDLIYQTILKNNRSLIEYFDVNATTKLLDNFFSNSDYKNNDRKIVEKISKFLKKYPSIYNIGYKMYLPIQDAQKYDFVSAPVVMLRLLTLNFYLQSFS